MADQISFAVSTQLLTDEFDKRGWHFDTLSNPNFVIAYPPHGDPIIIHCVLTELNSSVGYEIASDKLIFYEFARKFDLPVPPTIKYENPEQARDFMRQNGIIVVKPADTDKGIGVTTGVSDALQLDRAILKAGNVSKRVLLQKQVEGEDYRFLVIGEKVHAVGKRSRAFVVGDGKHTILELLKIKNDMRLHDTQRFKLPEISIDDAKHHVGDKINEVLAEGRQIDVVGVANISRGGEFVDCTDLAHPSLKSIAVKAASLLKLKVAGVDIFCTDITKPAQVTGAVILEINKMPGLRMHADLKEKVGTAEAIVELLLSERGKK